jgi:hypothetical protein
LHLGRLSLRWRIIICGQDEIFANDKVLSYVSEEQRPDLVHGMNEAATRIHLPSVDSVVCSILFDEQQGAELLLVKSCIVTRSTARTWNRTDFDPDLCGTHEAMLWATRQASIQYGNDGQSGGKLFQDLANAT